TLALTATFTATFARRAAFAPRTLAAFLHLHLLRLLPGRARAAECALVHLHAPMWRLVALLQLDRRSGEHIRVDRFGGVLRQRYAARHHQCHAENRQPSCF